jgi:hypothetical protein
MNSAQPSSRWERLKGRTKRAWSKLTRDGTQTAALNDTSLSATHACDARDIRGRESYLRELLRLLKGRQKELRQCSSERCESSDAREHQKTSWKSPD